MTEEPQRIVPFTDLRAELARMTEKAKTLSVESVLQHNVDQARKNIIGMRIEDGKHKLITDPAHGVVLADRHQKLNVKKRVLEAVLSASQEKINLLIALQQDILRNGGFFEDYTPTFESDRIENSVVDPDEGGWVIVESLGRPTRKNYSLSAEMAGGDIQMKLPTVRTTGFIDELRLSPKKKQRSKSRIESHSREIWEEIAETPAGVAWISDVCSLRGSDTFGPEYFAPVGFAAKAKDGVFSEIRKINAYRKVPVRWALSAVAEVVRLWNKAKTKILHEFHPTLLNQRGLDITQRERSGENGIVYRNAYLGKQLGRIMEVDLPGGGKGQLEFTWHIAAEEISRPGDSDESDFVE